MIYFSDTLEQLNEILSQKEAVFAVCDEHVKSIGEALGRCKGGKKIPVKYVTVSEKEKDLKLVSDICGWLLDKGADRNALVLAIGGGITTDVVGFAASIYKRGVKAAYVPTTLLAQVDAAIGGKTGVNFKKYKNMLGTIVEPEFTFVCSACLKTLPEATFRQGLAELLKAFLIENNNDNYSRAVQYFSGITSSTQYQDSTVLLPYIQSAVKVKERIVGEDLYESGLRRVLNLGHTFAHGIEHLSQKWNWFNKPTPIPHGDAVAMGIVLAARLSYKVGLCPEPLDERLRNDFLSCGLRVDCPYSPKEILKAAKTDKKAEGDIVHFVLLRGIGDVVIKDMKISEAIRAMENA